MTRTMTLAVIDADPLSRHGLNDLIEQVIGWQTSGSLIDTDALY